MSDTTFFSVDIWSLTSEYYDEYEGQKQHDLRQDIRNMETKDIMICLIEVLEKTILS